MAYDEEARTREQIGILVGLLNSEYESTRKLAVVQLTFVGPGGVPYLCSALEENLGNRRERMIKGLVEALGIISSLNAVPYVSKALPRLEAVDALSKIGTPQALAAIVEGVPEWWRERPDDPVKWWGGKSDSWDENTTRDFAVRSFSRFGKEAITALSKAIDESSSRELFKCACSVFAEMGDKSLGPQLARCLRQSAPEVKLAAMAASKKLKATIPESDLMEEVEELRSRWHKTSSVQRMDIGPRERREVEELLMAVTDGCRTESLADFLLSLNSEEDSFLRKIVEWRVSTDSSRVMPLLTKTLEGGSNAQQAIAADLIAKAKRPNPVEKPVPLKLDYY